MAPEPALTTAYLSYIVLSNYPIIACQVLIFFESVRVLPGEVRMYVRMVNRGKINIAEILFLLTKYLSLLSIISDALTNLTSGWVDVTGCKALSWIYQMLLFFCTTLISTTLAWRCYVIFQRRYRVGVWLLLGLTVQLTAAMATAQFQIKMKTVVDGYCSYLDEDIMEANARPWYQKLGIWFLLYSFLFDSTLVICTSWRLIRCVRGPSGLQRIGKLLFVNNLHYIAIVGGLNLAEFFIFVFFSGQLPTLLPLTIVVEVMIGMNLIIAEQDAAHGYGRTTTTGYTGMPSNFTGGPRPSSAGVSNWTDSKGQITTRGTTSRGAGLEGIRFDCNEEVLVDYDVTLTQMSPAAADTWSPACPNGPEVDRFDRFVPGGEHPLADKPYAYGSSSSAYPFTGQGGYSSTPPALGQQGQGSASTHTRSNDPLGVPQSSPPRSGSGAATSGLSIKAIRAQMNQNEANNQAAAREGARSANGSWGGGQESPRDYQGGYSLRPLSGHQQDQQGSGGAAGSSRQMLKRSDSMGSFASHCTCQESMYSANPATATSGQMSNRSPVEHDGHHRQYHGGAGHNDLEEMAQPHYDSDAPFADYRPQPDHGRGAGPGSAY